MQTRRLYCAANYEDLSEVIQHVKKLNPNVKLGATGISMGGLLLGNYLAEQNEEARHIFTACNIISVPWDVQKGALLVKTYLNNNCIISFCDETRTSNTKTKTIKREKNEIYRHYQLI